MPIIYKKLEVKITMSQKFTCLRVEHLFFTFCTCVTFSVNFQSVSKKSGGSLFIKSFFGILSKYNTSWSNLPKISIQKHFYWSQLLSKHWSLFSQNDLFRPPSWNTVFMFEICWFIAGLNITSLYIYGKPGLSTFDFFLIERRAKKSVKDMARKITVYQKTYMYVLRNVSKTYIYVLRGEKVKVIVNLHPAPSSIHTTRQKWLIVCRNTVSVYSNN